MPSSYLSRYVDQAMELDESDATSPQKKQDDHPAAQSSLEVPSRRKGSIESPRSLAPSSQYISEKEAISVASPVHRRRASSLIPPAMLLDEVKEVLTDANDRIQEISLKRLRGIDIGVELREMLQVLDNNLELHAADLQIHMNSDVIGLALGKLRTTLKRTIPLLGKVRATKYIISMAVKRELRMVFRELNASSTSLFMELSIAMAASGSGVPENDDNSALGSTEANGAEEVCLMGDRLYFGHGKDQNYTEAFRCYLNGAERGYDIAMVCLAMMYKKGLGVQEDLEQAKIWLNKAASLGNLDAKCQLGEIQYEVAAALLDDRQKQHTYGLAMANFKEAAEKGHRDAQAYLGTFYEKGLVSFPNAEVASEWYLKAAQAGHHRAQNALGSLYYRGSGVTEDYVKAVYWFHQASLQNDPVAQNNLGLCHERGAGVRVDQKKAISLYRAAAQGGNVNAMVNLAFSLVKLLPSEHYVGQREDFYYEALRLLLRASSEDIADAHYGIGILLDGRLGGCITDAKAALKHYCIAAQFSHVKAALMAGSMYVQGLSISRDIEKAMYYYSIAAKQHDMEALNALGEIYEDGHGFQRQSQLAAECYSDAANLGSAEGHYNLGRMLHTGAGIPQDLDAATEHFRKASDLGYANIPPELLKQPTQSKPTRAIRHEKEGVNDDSIENTSNA